MERVNRQWLLARRPAGEIVPEDFEYRELAFEEPKLEPGQIQVQSLLFRCTPAMRTMMKATSQFMPPMTIDEPVMGSVAAKVISSANSNYPVGSIISGFTHWQDYSVIDADKAPPNLKPKDVSLEDFEGIYGGNSIRLYITKLNIWIFHALQTRHLFHHPPFP